ncbi:MAG: hypothetical protein P9L92_01390 [Candidatus Electryonea clarkiae]|nr:hypothetical protein [Candidatus Electryonea clarkiae]MDP8286433.1 hypothetical protein [Candidatus Electryonea clarkiae]
MSNANSSAVSSRLNIPVNSETRSYLEEVASRRGVKLAEIGREALEMFIRKQKRQERLERLCETAEKYRAIIEDVGDEWRVTELDGLTNE